MYMSHFHLLLIERIQQFLEEVAHPPPLNETMNATARIARMSSLCDYETKVESRFAAAASPLLRLPAGWVMRKTVSCCFFILHHFHIFLCS